MDITVMKLVWLGWNLFVALFSLYRMGKGVWKRDEVKVGTWFIVFLMTMSVVFEIMAPGAAVIWRVGAEGALP